MLIECMVLRSGMTPIDIKQHHIQFMPIPGSKKGELTTSMADVADEEDIKYLMSRPNFREFDQETAYKDLLARRKDLEEKAGRFNGFSIEKLVIGGVDRGYMLVDFRKTSPVFGGQDGKWTQTYSDVMPFKDQASASDYLSHYVPGKGSEDGGNYACQVEGCTRKFATAIELSDHIKQAHKPKKE